MFKNCAIFLLGAAVAAALILGFTSNEPHDHHHHHDHEHEHDLVDIEADAHQITVKTAGPGEIKTTFATRGKVILHPDRRAIILPKVAGIVKEVRVNRGDLVNPKQVVAVIESKEIAEAKSEYLAAGEREKLAETLFEREERLYQSKIASEEDFLNAQSHLQEAKINARLALQKLYAMGLSENEIMHKDDENLRLYEVRSPIRGTVVDRQITYGAYLDEKTPIFEIADLGHLLVEMGIYPKDLGKVQAGQTAEVECAGKICEGRIIYVSPLIDEDTITAKALIELNKEEGWLPGTFVKVTVNADIQNHPVIVTKESIQTIEGEPVIFVQTADGFLKTNVKLGPSDDLNAAITEGLEPGQEYAATGAFLLKADMGKDTLEHEH